MPTPLTLALVTAVFDHSYTRTLLPAPFLLGSTINMRQQAGGFFNETAAGNTGNGTSTNTFTYVDTKGNTYDREVSAVDNVITADHQGGSLAPAPAVVGGVQGAAFIAQARLPGGRVKGGKP